MMKTLNKTASLLLAGNLANAIKIPGHDADDIDIKIIVKETKSEYKKAGSRTISLLIEKNFLFPLQGSESTTDTKTYHGVTTRLLPGNNFVNAKTNYLN